MSSICIGSRESKLAVIQTTLVAHQIKERYPEIEVSLLTMKTTGDKILDRSLDKIGGKGLFVKELDKALLEGKTNLSVHSLKDMPMEESEELPILAYSKREDPRDVLVLPKGATTLDLSKPIGCSSLRRKIQFERLYPEASFSGIRGNVITRLEKLDRGEYGGLILAAAGLIRLGLKERITRFFEPEEIIPCAGQGILAVQGRKDEDYFYLDAVNDLESKKRAVAERAFVRYLDGGCSSPVAAYAKIEKETLFLRGLYYDESTKKYKTGTKSGPIDDGEYIGISLAEELKGDGNL